MAVYLGQLIFEPQARAKLGSKHGISVDAVRDALEWPAAARTAWHDHPEHGRRLLAWGDTDGAEVFAVLVPLPRWDEQSDTWLVRTARWVG